MKKTTLLGTLTFCGFAALLSCDNGASPRSGSLADDDCPIGTFRPPGHPDCVFPADDQFGSPLGVSDNRCASGQPALPPVCVSNEGGRTYFSLTKDCAPNYRFEPGACQRDGGQGFGGSFGTTGGTGTPTGFFAGTAGAAAPGTGAAGATGVAGTTGFATGTGGGAGEVASGSAGVTTGAAAVAGN